MYYKEEDVKGRRLDLLLSPHCSVVTVEPVYTCPVTFLLLAGALPLNLSYSTPALQQQCDVSHYFTALEMLILFCKRRP